jgi:D-cysteine desulfhydrase family pyridoxal phosphate-dependent enzyme
METIKLPRLKFAHLPTIVEPMPRLSAHLGGAHLWVKRDDQTGIAFGGNKTRKLEFLLAEAQSHGARTLITWGAAQSNHCRQTAGAAARNGFECIVVVRGAGAAQTTGNLLLDELLGAEVVWAGDRDPGDVAKESFDRAWEGGRRPYLIPYGGSNPIGASAYAAAMAEFVEQAVPVDRIVFASSSGGTQSGLVVGARLYGFEGKITGISVDQPAPVLREKISRLASETASVLGQDFSFQPNDIDVNDHFLGGGYGVMGELEREAIRTLARFEGLIVDPVYTGRAAGGLMQLIRSGDIDREERVLFWHTGGTPAVFAYADALASDS